jgi:hypothetical protein
LELYIEECPSDVASSVVQLQDAIVGAEDFSNIRSGTMSIVDIGCNQSMIADKSCTISATKQAKIPITGPVVR